MNQQRWKRVESIYNAAVGCRPETRAALLQTACDGDDELRREVESLLAQDSKDGPLDHASGRTLGPYQLLEPIGSGGMGTVFKARDTRLDRIVAVKVSTGQFSRRFAVEAQAAAALNHPHVCTLHDVGPNYLVMEFVEGETLAARLQNGPLALERAVEYGAQVADAVAAAHARGVIHRDLKPANIMLTKSGVKVLDFGVAKRVEADETQTAEGAVVGTVAYMAPEQAEGKAVDGRTDIFAFGAVLYEMATGRQAFRGDSTLATLAAVLQKEPPPASLPAELERLIRRCLRKDPDQRFQNMADVKMALEDVHLDAPAGEASRPTGRRWPAPAAVGFGAGFLAACTIWLTAARPPFPDQSQYRFTPFAFDPGGQTGAVWSPDGKAVAYAARGEGGAFQVFLRRLDADAPVQVTQIPEKATPLAWTPDSHRILFQTTREPRGVWSVAAVGGEPEPFFPTADSTVAVAPNGKAAAVLHQGEGGRIGIWISDPAGSPLRKYSPDPFATQRVFGQASLGFSPDGRNILLLLSGGANRQEAWLVPYPPGSGRAPRRVLPDLPSYGRTPGFSWMPDSRRVALSMPAAPEGSNQLWLADTASRSRQALTSGGGMHRNAPAVSPDGRKMAYTEARSNYDVMTAGLDGSAARPLFSTDRNEMMPAWAAKREALVYVTDRNGPQEIWMRSAGADRRLVSEQDFPPDTTRWFVAPALSPNGSRVVYSRIERKGGARLWISAVSGGAPIPLTNAEAGEGAGSWSPDGDWFAYTLPGGDLMKVKTTGQATPALLQRGNEGEAAGAGIPSWSPTGEWIAVGKGMISADGKSRRSWGEHGSSHSMFSADGKLVYGIRPEGERNLLFSLDIATGVEKAIGDLGRDAAPATPLTSGIRFSLAPDGKSFVYAAARQTTSIWLLEGFTQKAGLLARLGLR